MEIVRQGQQLGQASPFEVLKRVEDGREFWSARDMQKLLGYVRWGNFQGALERLALSLKNSGENPADHVLQVQHMIEVGKGAKRQAEDYHLSRLAAYLLAMNGDPENPEVALAQRYFATQARRAELTQQQALASAGRRELFLEAKSAALDKMAAQVVTVDAVAHAYGGGVKKAADQLSLKNIAPLGYFVTRGKEVEVYPMLEVHQQFRAGMGPLEGRALLAHDGDWNAYEQRAKLTLTPVH